MKSKTARRVVWIALTGLIAMASAILLAIVLLCRDIPPPDFSDLAVKREVVPPEKNAFTYLSAATNSLYWPTNSVLVSDIIDGTTNDPEFIAEIVAKNQEALGLIHTALTCETLQAPEVESYATLIPYVSCWKNMSRLLALKAMQERAEGKYAEATDTCIDLCRFGDMIQKSPETIINYLVGIVILNTGLEQARHTACSVGMSEADLGELSTSLSNIGPMDTGFVRGIKTEFKMTCRATDDIRSGKMNFGGLVEDQSKATWNYAKAPYLFQQNRTKELFAGYFRHMIRNASRKYADREQSGIEKYVAEQQGNKLKLFASPNSIGKILFIMLIPALDKISGLRCRLECDLAATRLIVACQAFKRSKGTFPDSLDELVPKHIAAVPLDPCDGEPFRYSREKGIVYSVGKDLLDSGGSEESTSSVDKPASGAGRWRAKDYVLHLEELKAEPGR